jgi:toxin ParE1/3/4
MTLAIVYTPGSLRHLEEIFDYIAEHGDPVTARNYTKRLENVCQSLERFPLRGTPRDDIRPGLRTLAHKRSATIAFSVEGHSVVIHGIFKAGLDYETILREINQSEGD